MSGIFVRIWLVFVVMLGLTSQPCSAGTYKAYAMGLVQALPAGATFRPDLEKDLANFATAYRLSQGKPALKADPLFLVAARAQAADMMIHNYVGHRASTGQEFESRMIALAGDITRFPALAENAARDTRDTPADIDKARALFQQWLDSPPHRKALRSLDYQYVSTGVAQRGNSIWAVQIFWATPREKGLFGN